MCEEVSAATIYREALERVAAQQPATLAMIERNGFVFDDIGHEPGNWQHLAFSVYTDLCEVDLVARLALQEADDLAADASQTSLEVPPSS